MDKEIIGVAIISPNTEKEERVPFKEIKKNSDGTYTLKTVDRKEIKIN